MANKQKRLKPTQHFNTKTEDQPSDKPQTPFCKEEKNKKQKKIIKTLIKKTEKKETLRFISTKSPEKQNRTANYYA